MGGWSWGGGAGAWVAGGYCPYFKGRRRGRLRGKIINEREGERDRDRETETGRDRQGQ